MESKSDSSGLRQKNRVQLYREKMTVLLHDQSSYEMTLATSYLPLGVFWAWVEAPGVDPGHQKELHSISQDPQEKLEGRRCSPIKDMWRWSDGWFRSYSSVKADFQLSPQHLLEYDFISLCSPSLSHSTSTEVNVKQGWEMTDVKLASGWQGTWCPPSTPAGTPAQVQVKLLIAAQCRSAGGDVTTDHVFKCWSTTSDLI